MAEEESDRSFSEMVTQRLSPDTRELWAPMADCFDRDGPEAAKIYLGAELDRLKGNVKIALEEFRGS